VLIILAGSFTHQDDGSIMPKNRYALNRIYGKSDMKRRVLFVCTANSARSLMAEALLRDMAGNRFEVASAGTEPTRPHPMALQVLAEADISTEGLCSTKLADAQGQCWDYVITLCEKAANECGIVCQPAQQIAWDFADPVPANRKATFSVTLREIKERIALFALVHQKETAGSPARYDPVTIFKALGDEFRLAALLLIRSQGQLCVCELTEAFDVPQPRVSRHLATLRDVGFLETERRGQWVYYSLSTRIPQWLGRVLDETAASNTVLIENPLERLHTMADRPVVQCP
jgi:ArsR family transcriptional regulator